MQRHGFCGMLVGGLQRAPVCRVYAVRFRGGREVHHRLGECELSLRAAEEVIGVLRGERERKRPGIGEPYVFRRDPHQAPGNVQRVLAAGEHARQPVQRAFHVRAPHRFVQRRDQVVVLLTALVVFREALLQGVSDDGGGKGR